MQWFLPSKILIKYSLVPGDKGILSIEDSSRARWIVHSSGECIHPSIFNPFRCCPPYPTHAAQSWAGNTTVRNDYCNMNTVQDSSPNEMDHFPQFKQPPYRPPNTFRQGSVCLALVKLNNSLYLNSILSSFATIPTYPPALLSVKWIALILFTTGNQHIPYLMHHWKIPFLGFPTMISATFSKWSTPGSK